MRVVRNSAPAENRRVSSLANGYRLWRESKPLAIPMRPTFTEKCGWRDVDTQLSRREKIDCLLALEFDGVLTENFVSNVLRPADEGSAAIPENALGSFRCGGALQFRSSYIKSELASSRSDAIRVHHYVTTLYGEDQRPYVASVLKIISWRNLEDPTSKCSYALKVVNHRTTTETHLGSERIKVDIKSNTAGSGEGEWVGMIKAVSGRKPILLPKVIVARSRRGGNDVVVLSKSIYYACTVAADDYI